MNAEYQDKILERHAIVTAERRAIANFWFAYALHVGPKLREVLDGIGKRTPDLAPPVETIAAPVEPSRDDLRRSLGLG